MHCTDIKGYLYEYHTGRLAEQARKDVEAHLAACPACRQELEDLKIDLKLLEYARPPELSADFKERVMRDIEQPKVIPFLRRQTYKYVLQGTVAAVVLLAVAVTFIIKSQQPQEPVVRGEKPAPVTAECAKAVELYNKGSTTHDLRAKQQLFTEALVCNCDDKKILAKIHNNLADCYERQGRIDEAIDKYHKAIELDKDLYTAHVGLGDISKKQNNIQAAIKYYEQAIVVMETTATREVTSGYVEEIRKELIGLKGKAEE